MRDVQEIIAALECVDRCLDRRACEKHRAVLREHSGSLCDLREFIGAAAKCAEERRTCLTSGHVSDALVALACDFDLAYERLVSRLARGFADDMAVQREEHRKEGL